jgi:hypothetical protein
MGATVDTGFKKTVNKVLKYYQPKTNKGELYQEPLEIKVI